MRALIATLAGFLTILALSVFWNSGYFTLDSIHGDCGFWCLDELRISIPAHFIAAVLLVGLYRAVNPQEKHVAYGAKIGIIVGLMWTLPSSYLMDVSNDSQYFSTHPAMHSYDPMHPSFSVLILTLAGVAVALAFRHTERMGKTKPG